MYGCILRNLKQLLHILYLLEYTKLHFNMTNVIQIVYSHYIDVGRTVYEYYFAYNSIKI